MSMRAWRKGWTVTGAIALAIASLGTMAADIGALTTKAAAAAKSGDFNASIDSLEKALDQVRTEAPLTLKKFMVVSRPAAFPGDYEQRPSAEFKVGEQMYFYVELYNLACPRDAAGVCQPAYEVDLEIDGPDGGTMKQPRFKTFKQPMRSRMQDFLLNITLSLSKSPPGKYKVRFTVRDLNSKKTATVEQQVALK